MTTAPTTPTTGHITWTGHNLPDVQAFVGVTTDYDRIGFEFHTPAFKTSPDGTGLLWIEEEKAWIPVPVGHRIYRDLLERRWAMSPQALAATQDPIATAIVDVVVKPAATVQDTGRRIFSVLRQLRRRHAR